MSSTDPQDTPADEPSTELALREEVQQVRAELDQVRAAAAPARRVPNTIDQWVLVVRDYNLLAQSLAKTSFVPKDFQGKPDQITATMMYGREIGLPPMTTLQNTYVVHGRVGMYAEQLRAMILEAGHEIDIEEMTSDRCVVSGKRKGSDRWQRFEFTMDMAKAAGLYAANDNYRKRPAQQLFARASALLAHAMFPDVIRGMGSLEELEDEGQAAVDAPPVQPAPEKATRTVGRAAKKTPPAVEAKPSNPVAKEEVVIPDETLPPLPGETEVITEARLVSTDQDGSPRMDGVASETSPAGSTPGEGRTAEPSTPAGPNPAEPTERHCPDFDPHGPHVWPDEGEEWACIGVVPATDTGTGPVQDKPRTISPGTLRTLQARFKSLGYTDEPDDREARLRVAAVLGDVPGAELDSFKDLTQDQASQVLTVLGPLKDRGDVLELMVRASRPEDGA
jgi:hypothetical protein